MIIQLPAQLARETAETLGKLAADERLFARTVAAFQNADPDAFRETLEKAGIGIRCPIVCRWLCTWYCVRVCRLICDPIVVDPGWVPELPAFAKGLARLMSDERNLTALIQAVEREESKTFHGILEQFELQPFCRLVCHWICHMRCRLFCNWACRLEGPTLDDLQAELKQSGAALASLAGEEDTLGALSEAFDKLDVHRVREALDKGRLFEHCHYICFWLCVWRCERVCRRFCIDLPIQIPDPRELRELTLGVAKLAGTEGALERLLDATEKVDVQAFHGTLEKFQLTRYCHLLCHWICFVHCKRVCILICLPPRCLSVFTHIGVFNHQTDIDSTPGGTGLTNVDQCAFYHVMRLNGVVCKQLGGEPVEYRFEVMPVPGGSWMPVLPHQIARTKIGLWQRQVGPVMEVKDYTINGTSGPNEVTITPAADGWIQVPQEDNVSSAAGNFAANGDLIRLDSRKIAPWPNINIAGIGAGQSTLPASLGANKNFAVRMRVRAVGPSGPGPENTAGVCDKVAVYNQLYDNVTKGGAWAPNLVDNQLAAVMVDVQEIGTGCAEITDSLTAVYTAANPNLGTVNIQMIGPGGPYSFTLVDDGGATPGNRYGHANPGFAVGALADCAYLVKLSATLRLTTGDHRPDPVWDEVAFCKVTPNGGNGS